MNSNLLSSSIHNEGKSVVAVRFKKLLKTKIYRKFTDDHSKYCPGYLNELLEEQKNTYHHSIVKKPFNTYCLDFTEEVESNHKVPKFNVVDRFRVTDIELIKNITPKTSEEKYFLLNLG